MRWLLVVLLAVSGCSAAPESVEGPPPTAAARPAPLASPDQNVAAVEPAPPTLAEFRRQARLACQAAAATIAQAPLRGDPLAAGAKPDDVRAAIGYFRASSSAWTAAAGQLWEFGLPRRRAGEKMITTLDTVGQYSKQAADFLQEGDDASAQAAVGAVDTAMNDANRVARVLGIGRLEQCADSPAKLRNPRRRAVTATDFALGVGAVARGPTRFVLRNDGREDHQIFVVRLREAGLLAEAVKEDRAGGKPSRYLAGAGRSSPVAGPGEQASVDVNVRPGPYGLVCFIASEDGTPHAYKGMATEIFVSP